MESSVARSRLVIVMTVLMACLVPVVVSSRELPFRLAVDDQKKEMGVFQCMDSLTELKGCTAEIIFFFINGESYLGQECCVAIRVITHKCWPSLLSSLGFTVEEVDVLQGYCDVAIAPPPDSGDGGAVPPIGGGGGGGK